MESTPACSVSQRQTRAICLAPVASATIFPFSFSTDIYIHTYVGKQLI